MEHSNSNWIWNNRKLQKVVDVLSADWWYSTGDEVLEWLEEESIGLWNVHYAKSGLPIIFLYTDKQAMYFNLRWGK